jgi:hypothetical protein
MSSDVRLRHALPRLLVSLAVLLCLLGLGESMPDGGADSHGDSAVAASAHSMRDMTHASAAGSASAVAESTDHSAHGAAGGHGEHGFHAAGCMVAVMATAVPFVVSTVTSDIGPGAWSPATSSGRLERGPTIAVGADPPDLSALCVQRV